MGDTTANNNSQHAQNDHLTQNDATCHCLRANCLLFVVVVVCCLLLVVVCCLLLFVVVVGCCWLLLVVGCG